MKQLLVFLALIVSPFLLAGCGATSTPTTTSPATTTDFAVMEDAKSVKELGDKTLNYQTNHSIPEVATFYRESYPDLTERTITTLENDSVLNLVLDGAEGEPALVIQATPLGDDVLNVNVRYEEI